MKTVSIDNFPELDKFLEYNDEKIREFCSLYDIKTCYLPVDGTRRHFILFSSTIKAWNESNLPDYYQHVNKSFQRIISQFYDFGISNLIILLMDKSAFSRGKTFLDETIKNGIKPLFEDQTYLELYDKYDVDVHFSGFTSVFNDYFDKKVLIELEKNFEKLRRDLGKRKLIVYTGLSPSEDYLLLEKCGNELRENNLPVTREDLIQKIYQTPLKDIDLTIWYGFPRDKIIPPLLWEKSINFFVKNPTLTIKSVQIKKAIYYCAMSKNSIGDNYVFHNFTEQEKLEELKEILGADSIMGSDYYY